MSSRHQEIADIILDAVNMEHIELNEQLIDAPLTEEPFDFDSIDFLESVVAIEEHYKVKLDSPAEAPEHFKSIRSISEFIDSKLSENPSS